MVDLFIATLCLINIGITLFGFIEKHTYLRNRMPLTCVLLKRLEIRFYRKQELVNEYLLKCSNVVLLIEHKHGFLIVYGIDRTERDGTIVVGYKDGIACYACSPFVAVGKCLYIR